MEVKGKRYCDLKNQADELVFVLAIVAPVVSEGYRTTDVRSLWAGKSFLKVIDGSWIEQISTELLW